MEIRNPGLVEDPREEEAKAKDYIHRETTPMSVLLKWDRGIEGAPIYSDRDQNGSGSCVAQGSSTALETLIGNVISAHPIYSRRKNAPLEGMWLQDAGDIVKNHGTTTEALDPSQKMSEQQMDTSVEVDTPINNFLYVFANIKNIDEIATAIELYKHCNITINGTIKEYAYSNKPVFDTTATKMDCAHCICGIYYYTDESGEKCILIKESWGPNNIRLRTLTESYIKARGTGAMYFIPPLAPIVPQKPVYRFTGGFNYGVTGSLSVKNLQDILKYETLFPLNIPSTGNYLQITAKGVLAWQLKHQIDAPEVLNALQGKKVGPKTILALNLIYS